LFQDTEIRRKMTAGRRAISATSRDSLRGIANMAQGTDSGSVSTGLPKFQNDLDFAFSRLSLDEVPSFGASLIPCRQPCSLQGIRDGSRVYRSRNLYLAVQITALQRRRANIG
jgi:hypothetical protein